MLTLTYRLLTDAAAVRAAEVAQARAAPLLDNVRELAACSMGQSKVLEAEYLAVPDLPPLCLPSLDGARGSGVYGALKALVDDPHFLPAGGALSFLAQHAYPVTALRQRRRCGALLRGGDLLLAAAARALGLGVRVDVLFEQEKYYDYSADPSFVRLAPPEYPGLFEVPTEPRECAIFEDLSPLAKCKPPRNAVAASRPIHDGRCGPQEARGRTQLAAVTATYVEDPYLATLRGYPAIVVELPPHRAARPPLGRHA
jgi:hypothetical protein